VISIPFRAFNSRITHSHVIYSLDLPQFRHNKVQKSHRMRWLVKRQTLIKK